MNSAFGKLVQQIYLNDGMIFTFAGSCIGAGYTGGYVFNNTALAMPIGGVAGAMFYPASIFYMMFAKNPKYVQ